MYSIPEYLQKKYNFNEVPTYNAACCTERKSLGESCRVCVDACPKGIYPAGKRKRPVWTQCLKCGVCAAACPARCITPPYSGVNNFLMAIAKKEDMSVGCAEEKEGFLLTVSCVAALSWEQLAYAALNKKLVVSLRGCADCALEECKRQIAENLKKLRVFLGEALCAERVRILEKGEEYEPHGAPISRRELFSIAGNLPIDRVFQIMPEIGESENRGLFYRALLRDETVRRYRETGEGKRHKYGVQLPLFNDGCNGCGKCAASCPQSALELVESEAGAAIAVRVWKCVGCGICKNACAAGAISSVSWMKVPHIDRVALGKSEGK